MSKVVDIRRANLRALIGERGGLTDLSNRLGYRNPSFLSQMAGPNPTREVTEKTARKIEQTLGLGVGSLDRPIGQQRPASQAAEAPQHDDLVLAVAEVIRQVGRACEDEGVTLAPAKFAEVAALVLEGSPTPADRPRPEHVRRLVSLLK